MNRNGYTLIELLVVLGLLGLLTTMLFRGLHDAGRAEKRLVQNNNGREQLQVSHDILRRLLSNANPTVLVDRNGQYTSMFRGDAKSLSFLAPLRLSSGAGDIIGAYQLHITRDGEMRLGWHFNQDSTVGGAAGSVNTTLLRKLSNGILTYYGSRESGEDPFWATDWIEQKTLPLLIRIRFLWRHQQQDWLFAPVITEKTCLTSSFNAACSK